MKPFRKMDSQLLRKGGLSLYEILVVVSVFAILATLFVLSSRQMITRTNISRVKNDQHLTEQALTTYYWDHTSFPEESEGLARLPMLRTAPIDPFGEGNKSTFVYRKISDSLCVIISPGPDGKLDFEAGEDEGFFSFGSLAATIRSGDIGKRTSTQDWDKLRSEYLEKYAYDPTNGWQSGGDIFRFVIIK